MPEDIDYHENKQPYKTYVSKSIPTGGVDGQPVRRLRIASKSWILHILTPMLLSGTKLFCE